MRNANKFYINGEWVTPLTGETCEVINPATEEPIASIALGGQQDVDAAVSAAKTAFTSFSQTSVEERLDLLGRIIDAYKAKMSEIAKTVSMEMGAPMGLANAAQAPAGLGHLIFAQKALKNFEFIEDVGSSRVIREPIGVCGLITPWNWPVNQNHRKGRTGLGCRMHNGTQTIGNCPTKCLTVCRGHGGSRHSPRRF